MGNGGSAQLPQAHGRPPYLRKPFKIIVVLFEEEPPAAQKQDYNRKQQGKGNAYGEPGLTPVFIPLLPQPLVLAALFFKRPVRAPLVAAGFGQHCENIVAEFDPAHAAAEIVAQQPARHKCIDVCRRYAGMLHVIKRLGHAISVTGKQVVFHIRPGFRRDSAHGFFIEGLKDAFPGCVYLLQGDGIAALLNTPAVKTGAEKRQDGRLYAGRCFPVTTGGIHPCDGIDNGVSNSFIHQRTAGMQHGFHGLVNTHGLHTYPVARDGRPTGGEFFKAGKKVFPKA
ncbi:MAG: hypothetical protein BWY09_00601 [Candidatus Hydrogenedentes bacterium ADurb.Bin179]|nr:MAG: hypothetical protein BWY09_00601 [Candidatus Hydrogenedentes bacterium ADurb.Bin179]